MTTHSTDPNATRRKNRETLIKNFFFPFPPAVSFVTGLYIIRHDMETSKEFKVVLLGEGTSSMEAARHAKRQNQQFAPKKVARDFYCWPSKKGRWKLAVLFTDTDRARGLSFLLL